MVNRETYYFPCQECGNELATLVITEIRRDQKCLVAVEELDGCACSACGELVDEDDVVEYITEIIEYETVEDHEPWGDVEWE